MFCQFGEHVNFNQYRMLLELDQC